MDAFETFLNEFCNALKARTPFLVLGTQDLHLPKQLVMEYGEGQLPSERLEAAIGEFDHIFYNAETIRVYEDGEFVDYDRSYLPDKTNQGGNPHELAVQNTRFVSSDELQPNSLVIEPNLYRWWSEGERLDDRTSSQLYDYYERLRSTNSVTLIINPTSNLPQDDEGLFQRIDYSYPSHQHRAHIIRQYADDHENSRPLIANEDGLIDWSKGLTIRQIETALDNFAVTFDEGRHAPEALFCSLKDDLLNVRPEIKTAYHFEHDPDDASIEAITTIQHDEFFSEELFEEGLGEIEAEISKADNEVSGLFETTGTPYGKRCLELELKDGLLHPRDYLPPIAAFCRRVFPGLYEGNSLNSVVEFDAYEMRRGTAQQLSHLCPALYVPQSGIHDSYEKLTRAIEHPDWIYVLSSDEQTFRLVMKHWSDEDLEAMTA